MRIIWAPQPGGPATTVMILVAAGSKYETKNISGLSHFLEHLSFKGTVKRPHSLMIAEELDKLGAHYNAFTSEEFTSYYAKVKNDHLPQALEIVSDLYLNPLFDPQEIEKEKGVIIEEINMYEDMPKRRVQDLFMKVVYGNQPAGRGVLGNKEVIRRLKKEDFNRYRKAHYLPQATIVVVSGGWSEEKRAIDLVKRYFGELKQTPKGDKLRVREAQSRPRTLVQFKNSDQTHLVLGFRAFGVSDKRRFALQVLTNLLGGGMSSRLFQKIREELGAAYYVRALTDLYSDHGLIFMEAGVDHKKAALVVKTALQEFSRLTREKPGRNELLKAKDHLVGNLFLSLETSDELGYFYGGQEIMGLPLQSPEEAARRLQAVSAEEVRSVARAIFRDNRLNLAAIGPFRKEKFNGILKLP